MTEERRQILEMLAEGKINADEADRLIGALGGSSATATATSAAVQTKPLPKFVRIMIDAKEGRHDKPVHVNVRVPVALLRAGVRFGSLIPIQAQERMNAEFRKNGLDFDIRQVKPENINELIDQLQDLSIDVDQEDDDTKIRIFTE
jgi:polyhydroxyalkanoate synthesis regulator phasin